MKIPRGIGHTNPQNKWMIGLALLAMVIHLHSCTPIELGEFRGYPRESLNLGRVGMLLMTESVYLAKDCKVVILGQASTPSGVGLAVMDTDPNEQPPAGQVRVKVPTYLLATTGINPGEWGFKLTCADITGIGIFRVLSTDWISASEWANVSLYVNRKQEEVTFLPLDNFEGQNLSMKIAGSSDPAWILQSRLSSLKFYENDDMGVLRPVSTKTFEKILSLREHRWDRPDRLTSLEDLSSVIAVVETQGLSVGYYELEHSQSLGLVYVFTGRKYMDPGKNKKLSHCFPTVRKGKVINYYCLFEELDAKKPGPIVYFDLASTNEQLEGRVFGDVRAVLASEPMWSEDKTCLLAIGLDGKRKILCMDATRGLGQIEYNLDGYFLGNRVKINIGEECTLDAADLDEEEFRFPSSAVFTCSSGKRVAAAVRMVPSVDAKDPPAWKVTTVREISENIDVLCVDDEDVVLYDGQTMTVMGGKTRPGENIKIAINGPVQNVHCLHNHILMIGGGKKPVLLDVARRIWHRVARRLIASVPLPPGSEKLKVAMGYMPVVYSINKRDEVEGTMMYIPVAGLLSLVRGDHRYSLVLTNGNTSVPVEVNVQRGREERLEVRKIRSLSEAVPGEVYNLRDYFKVSGQIYSLDYSPRVHSVYMYADRVSLENTYTHKAEGSQFAVEDCFVDSLERVWTDGQGKVHRLEGKILQPSRYIGTVQTDIPLGLTGHIESGGLLVQGYYVDRTGTVRTTDIIKLGGDFSAELFQSPQVERGRGQGKIRIYWRAGMSREIDYQYTPEDKMITIRAGSEEAQWRDPDRIGIYRLAVVEEHDNERINPCVHIRAEGGDLDIPLIYPICGITGGWVNRVQLFNLTNSTDGVEFELLVQPSRESGNEILTWWKIYTNLRENNAWVSKDRLIVRTERLGELGGLAYHIVRSVQRVGAGICVLSEYRDNTAGGGVGLYESYYLPPSIYPLLMQRFSDDRTDWDKYELRIESSKSSIKRVFANHQNNSATVSDVLFFPSQIRLSKHTATIHVKYPFTLDFNRGSHIESNFFIDLKQYYPDDGKTDDDDVRPNPKPVPDDGKDPDSKKSGRSSRLWFIWGIILLIFFIGGLDLYLRRHKHLHDHSHSDISDESHHEEKQNIHQIKEIEPHAEASVKSVHSARSAHSPEIDSPTRSLDKRDSKPSKDLPGDKGYAEEI